MKRILSVTVVSLLAAALLSFTPASAGPADVCAGQGTANTQSNVFYPTFGPSAAGIVTFNFAVGGCVLGHSSSANGAFTNSGMVEDLVDVGNFCGHSEGNVSIDEHPGHWVSAASMLVIAGGQTGINGVVNAVPDATTGHSCITGASGFLVTGAVNLA